MIQRMETPNTCFSSQSLEYWLWKILNMFGFVWVFTFYIEFVGEIFPFIFKLGAQTTAFCKDQRLGGTKNRFAFLTLVLAKANLSPHKFFIPPPPSYLMAHSYISQVSPYPCLFFPLVLWGEVSVYNISISFPEWPWNTPKAAINW